MGALDPTQPIKTHYSVDMSDIKEVRVVPTMGGAATRPRKTRKQAGGAGPIEDIGVVSDLMKGAASTASAAYGQTLQGVTPTLSSGTLTSQIIPPAEMHRDPVGSGGAVALAQTPMAGGQKVELKAPMHKTRVALRAPRRMREAAGGCIGSKTHRARKIGIAVKKLGKKLKKAHKTAKRVAKMSIETVKAALVKAGVLKGGSKAPDALLRKMYADLKTTERGL
jgi:hypothetical protein